MTRKNKCLGWHLSSFKHCNYEVAIDLKNIRIFYSCLFCNFELGIFSCGFGKEDTIFNWEYDPILAIK